MLNTLVALLHALRAHWIVLVILLLVTLYTLSIPRIKSFFVKEPPYSPSHELTEVPANVRVPQTGPPSDGERNEDLDDFQQCNLCNFIYSRDEHLHLHRTRAHKDIYCVDCRRMFKSPNNLRVHRRSSVHVSDSVHCVAGCGQMFGLPSAMWLHVERGGCPAAVAALGVAIENLIAVDTRNSIVKPGIQLSDVRTVRWMVSNDMYDADMDLWHCYMCNKTTSRSGYMQMHLDGGAHDRNVFHCPDSRCRKESSTISTLMRHWERKECQGYRIARNVFRGRN